MQMGRHANLSPRSMVAPDQQVDMNGADLAARDRYLRATVDAVDPALEEHKV